MTLLNLFQDILSQKQYLYRALLLMVLLVIAFLFVRDNGKEAKTKLLSVLRRPWLAAFFFYMALILTSTVFARTRINPYREVFTHFGIFLNGKLNVEFVHNTLFYIPYSFFFLQAFKPGKPWKAALIVSAATSLFVELSQLLFWLGQFQFSDIFHNILGGMIGCAIWCLIERIRRKRSS